MANAEAVALVTVPALLDRVPQWDLPSLKHIFLVVRRPRACPRATTAMKS